MRRFRLASPPGGRDKARPPGIPPAERERVFEPFYRLPGHDVTGSGPGLAIAKTLTTQLGGTIHLTDAPEGPGLRVIARFPTRLRLA